MTAKNSRLSNSAARYAIIAIWAIMSGCLAAVISLRLSHFWLIVTITSAVMPVLIVMLLRWATAAPDPNKQRLDRLRSEVKAWSLAGLHKSAADLEDQIKELMGRRERLYPQLRHKGPEFGLVEYYVWLKHNRSDQINRVEDEIEFCRDQLEVINYELFDRPRRQRA